MEDRLSLIAACGVMASFMLTIIAVSTARIADALERNQKEDKK